MTFTTLYLLLPLYAFSSLLQNSDLTHLQCKLLDADRSCWTHWVRLQTPWLPCVLNIYMKIIVFYDDYWNFYIKIRFNYIVQYLPITKIGPVTNWTNVADWGVLLSPWSFLLLIRLKIDSTNLNYDSSKVIWLCVVYFIMLKNKISKTFQFMQ